MSLTAEQINNLNIGDTVLVPVVVMYKDKNSFAGSAGAFGTCFSYDEACTLPTPPKYDPCRPFKRGDKATPRIVNGRKPVCGIDGVAAEINSVELIVESNEGERENGTVDIKFPCGTIGQIDPVYLELVTPVEEMEPYYVKETASVYEVFNRNENNSSVAIFFKSQYPIGKAKERAVAELDRMNEEYRKEQHNG